jgi:hypothetical protein
VHFDDRDAGNSIEFAHATYDDGTSDDPLLIEAGSGRTLVELFIRLVGELRRPLGIAIVGGLIFSQMLTLYTTPVVYLYLDRLRRSAGTDRFPMPSVVSAFARL